MTGIKAPWEDHPHLTWGTCGGLTLPAYRRPNSHLAGDRRGGCPGGKNCSPPTSGMETLPSRPALRRASGSLRPGPVLKGSGTHSGADNRRVWGLQPPPDSLPAGSPRMAACPDLSPQPRAWRLGARGPPESCHAEPRPWGHPAPRRHSGWAAVETSRSTSRVGGRCPPLAPIKARKGSSRPAGRGRDRKPRQRPRAAPTTDRPRGCSRDTAGVRRARGLGTWTAVTPEAPRPLSQLQVFRPRCPQL